MATIYYFYVTELLQEDLPAKKMISSFMTGKLTRLLMSDL